MVFRGQLFRVFFFKQLKTIMRLPVLWLAPMGGAKQQLLNIFLSKLHFRNYFISKLSSQFLDGQLRTKNISYECPLSGGSGSKLPGRLYCN